jgi:hypothetical protein
MPFWLKWTLSGFLKFIPLPRNLCSGKVYTCHVNLDSRKIITNQDLILVKVFGVTPCWQLVFWDDKMVSSCISEQHLWSAIKWDTHVVRLQRHVVRKLVTQTHWRREDKTSQSSGNMIRTCGNPDTKLPDRWQHPTQGTNRSEKWKDSLCYGQRWEMGTKMLSTSSPLSLISPATFLATCVGNLTHSPHLLQPRR